MSSSDGLSKRERQKQRRGAKLEQQRAADARARRNRIIAFIALGAVFLGLVGIAVYRKQQADAEVQRQLAAAEAKLEEFGCTPDEKQEDAGQGHLDGSTLGQQPPEALYPDRPASSGEHYGNWIKTGVYDQVIDERALVHNLEHGYVVAYYDEGAEEEDVEALKADAQEKIDGDFKKVIVAPFDADLPGEANISYVAWTRRQTCEQFDPDIFSAFVRTHHSGAGVAPEKTLSAHLEEGNGTIDPGNEPFLLPPLGDEQPEAEGMNEDGSTVTPTDASS